MVFVKKKKGEHWSSLAVSKILLDTKKGLGAVVKFLDSLPQLLC